MKISHAACADPGVKLDAMSWNDVISKAESDEEILTFDVLDDALERAASAEQNAFTLVYCTNPWYNCGLPQ